jgi:LacI family transcriptional regulator
MRVNVQQVAERAGVSRMTVSRVLQERRDEVAEETYERVVAALRELEYVPVRTAFQNFHTKTNVVGVVPHSTDLSGYQLDLQTFGGISTRAAQAGYDILLAQRGESDWMGGRQELRFLDRRTDGFIFISPGISEWHRVLQHLVEHKVPVVTCYRRDVPEGVAWVDPDNEAIVHIAVDHLLEKGHTEIAYLGMPIKSAEEKKLLADLSGPRFNFDDQQRQMYFQERLRAAGVKNPEERFFTVSDPGLKLSREEVQAIVDSGATSVVCFTSQLSIQMLERLEEMGLKVPSDISLVGVDYQTTSLQRGITHVSFRVDKVGQLAMEAWLDLNNDIPAHESCRIVPAHLVECQSVAPPRR